MAFRVTSGVAFLLVCVAMFDVPSALVMTRGYSPWLALVIGVSTFPVVPLLWHLASERKRGASVTATTRWTRLRYRTLVVAAIAFAAVLVVGRAHLRDAVHDHLLWFLPDRANWFRGQPSPPGSHSSCEAYATMEMKCEAVVTDYAGLIASCMGVADVPGEIRARFQLVIEVAEQCALRTSACDDYRACIAKGGRDD